MGNSSDTMSFRNPLSVVGLALLLVSRLVSGQTPQRPDYQILRYDEDWSLLRDPGVRTDPWDRLKYLSLGNPGWFLTLAGEARERYELLNHPSFGSAPTDNNGYLLQRYLFSSDFHLGPRFRIFTELQSGLEAGRNGGPRLTDEDKLDVHQAFVDVRLLSRKNQNLKLRVGRQEVRFGTGRLISPGEGLNVRRSLDGARVIYETGPWTWNLTALRLVNVSPGYFDDVPDHSQSFWGAGVIGPHPIWKGANFTVYYLGADRKHAAFDRGVGRAIRETLGSRSWTVSGPWDLSYEGIFQWGSFQGEPIRAWALSSESGFTMSLPGWKPRIGLHADATSGDRGTGRRPLGSFDPLFPSSTAYPDPSGILGPTNLIVVEPTLKLQIVPQVSMTLATASFLRESLTDGIYGIFLNPLRPSGLSTARYVATQSSATLSWRISRHATAVWFYEHFFNGQFLTQSPPFRTVNFFNSTLSYRF